jgi:RNA ligase (TIGR02306 family)
MSKFECKVYKLEIEEHPNADALELAKVGEYRSIVQKGQFKTGDLGVYIPEAAVLPEWVIKRLGLEGKLAGKDKNRVKAIKLRGILSQGLIYPVEFREDVFEAATNMIDNHHCITVEYGGCGHIVKEGDDVTEWLGITKYEPPIPTHMAGEVFNAFGKTLKYDIENLKKYPDVLEEGEGVVITEKIHGTWCCMGSHPDVDVPIVTSKGLSEKGLAFKFNEANEKNLYIRAYEATKNTSECCIIERLQMVLGIYTEPLYVLGEIFGAGVQDLTYGGKPLQFRVFDIYIGNPGEGYYFTPAEVIELCDKLGEEMVPVLYSGPYSQEIVAEYTDGKETASGTEAHIREGVVIKPFVERKHEELGRVILKSVSENYLLRRGKATEYN